VRRWVPSQTGEGTEGLGALRYFTSTILTEFITTGALGRSLRSRGIEQIIEIKLTEEEKAALRKSAAAVKELVDIVKM
jgi:malate/lactate dehydrogenase